MAQKADLVYGPLVDAQEFPDEVDVTLVEGAVSTDEDVAKIQRVRQCSRILVALGDCAVTGNVPSMRNPVPVARLLERIYVDGADENKGVPTDRCRICRSRRGRYVIMCSRMCLSRVARPRRRRSLRW